ncbi:MAG: PKD domain-containing protein [Solirubrobacteraceae bacterium]
MALCAALALPSAAGAAAMQRLPGCTANTLPANDDSSTAAAVPLGFTIKIAQATYTSAWVNNNGNITFDGPLVDYTPTPIASTNHVIVAPFWGDVDTSAPGSAVVTYGTTTYQGHSAFCVEWDGVGYYNSHNDKLNKFEMLLVNRPDRASGDFDIIFNYDQVQWETGDASGGSGGLGGTSARVGWSFGSGGNVELPGSGTPGSFLDGGPDALASNDRASSTPGSYVFPVHGGQAPSARYVALGDSYSSGEGVPLFQGGSDTGSDKCHRSDGAYPELLVHQNAGGPIPSQVDFWACSGALTSDFTSPEHDFLEPPALNRLAPGDATLVSFSIGGNDIGFAHIGATCLQVTAGPRQLNGQENCRNLLDASTMAKIESLPLGPLFSQVRSDAPLADVYVMGYPRVLPANPSSDCKAQAYREDGSKATVNPFHPDTYVSGWLGIETRIAKDDVTWMDKVISRLNGKLSAAAAAAGFHYVDNENAFNGHDVCSNNEDPSNRPWAHGLVLFTNTNSSPPNPSPFSFHPNSYGQQAMENDLYHAITSGARPTVQQGQTSVVPVAVAVGQALLNIITHWPGSDMDTTLVSPSGQVFNASSPGIIHFKTGTMENYVIPNPQPGTWQVQVYGTHVDQGGETARVDSSTTTAAAVAPVAVLSATPSAGVAPTHVRFSATTSRGTFAPISSYRWNFGDGSTSRKAAVAHTYRRAGRYIARLIVTDSAGRSDTAQQTIKLYRTDQRPTVRLVVHQDRRHGARLYFDATGSSDPDGARVRLSLTFGDGRSASRATGVHRYRHNGVYKLNLVISDPRGLRRTRQVRIVVTHARPRPH